MSRISVCLATYNGNQFIVRQLLSILCQLESTDEVIISDDGSTDDTLKLINSLADPRIIVYLNADRHGPVGNFENALRHATGQYIVLSDQDDIWLPGKIYAIKKQLRSHDLVLTNCEVIDQKGAVLHSSFFAYRGSQPGFLRNLYKNSYIGCCMAFRRGVLDYALPFPSNLYMHDWWIGLLVELKGRVYFEPQPLIQYVRHGNNASPTGEGSLNWKHKIRNRVNLITNLLRHFFS